MKRHFVAAATVLASISVVAGSPSWGSPAVQRDPISLDLKDAPAAEVLAAFASMTEAKAEVDPAVAGPVTIHLDGVSWMTALDAVCDTLSCRWALQGGEEGRRLEFHPRPDVEAPSSGLDSSLSLSLRRAAAIEVLMAFAEISGRTLVTPDGLEGLVTIELDGVRARTALTAVCESLGYRWSEEEDGTLKVSSWRDGDSKAETKKPAPSEAASSAGQAAAEVKLDLDLKDAPLPAVFKSFAQILEAELDLSPALGGTVTVKLEKVTALEALDALCRRARCSWKLHEGPPGRRTLVVAKA